MKLVRLATAIALFLGVLGTAEAADLGAGFAPAPAPPAPARFASDYLELRGGVFWHQFWGPKHDEAEGGTVSLNGEVVVPGFRRPADSSFTEILFAPRFHAGYMGNVEGFTSYGYAGLTWTFDVTPRWFVDVGFGAGVSDGETKRVPGRINVGCALGFHETLSFGYRWSENWSTMLTFTHVSNANICPPNHGINTVGLRTSYRF